MADTPFGKQQIFIGKRSDFKMPDINLEYIKSSQGMTNFLNSSVDDFDESVIKAEADCDTDSIQTQDDEGYEQIMIRKGAIKFGHSQHSQPAFHEEGRTFCQRIFPYLASSTDLDGEELHAYHTIKAQYVVPFSQENEVHEVSFLNFLIDSK